MGVLSSGGKLLTVGGKLAEVQNSAFPPRDTGTDWKSDNFIGLYLTYDNSFLPAGHPKKNIYLEFTKKTGTESDYTVETGIIKNGVFVVKDTLTGWLTAGSSDGIGFDVPYYGERYTVIRITPSADVTVKSVFQNGSHFNDYIVDRYGRLPDLVQWHSQGYSDYAGWQLLIRDGVISGKRNDINALNYMMRSLVETAPIVIGGDIPSYAATAQRAFSSCAMLKKVDITFDNAPVKSLQNTFYNCASLEEIACSGLDTSQATSMAYAFQNCYKLKSIDTTLLNTSLVTTMRQMFASCYSLTSIDLSSFNTANVTSMQGMFEFCKNLTTLDLSSFDTSSVTTMAGMFQYSNILASIDLSSFNTANVTSMQDMFKYCENLTMLDLSGFDTATVKYFQSMFDNCIKLETLDISNFDTAGANNYTSMFSNCKALENFTACVFYKSVSFSASVNLTHDSLMSIINNLATVTSAQTLTLGATNKAKLSADEIAIATGKGWTVA